MKTVLIYVGAIGFWLSVYTFISWWGMKIQGLSYFEHIDMFAVF